MKFGRPRIKLVYEGPLLDLIASVLTAVTGMVEEEVNPAALKQILGLVEGVVSRIYEAHPDFEKGWTVELIRTQRGGPPVLSLQGPNRFGFFVELVEL